MISIANFTSLSCLLYPRISAASYLIHVIIGLHSLCIKKLIIVYIVPKYSIYLAFACPFQYITNTVPGKKYDVRRQIFLIKCASLNVTVDSNLYSSLFPCHLRVLTCNLFCCILQFESLPLVTFLIRYLDDLTCAHFLGSRLDIFYMPMYKRKELFYTRTFSKHYVDT